MTEQLILFETSKLAKEKGFPQEWGKVYYNGKLETTTMSGGCIYDFNKKYHSAPTQSLLQKWLRDNHDKIVLVCLDDVVEAYRVEIHCMKHKIIDADLFTIFNTYEDALEAGLIEALKLIVK